MKIKRLTYPQASDGREKLPTPPGSTPEPPSPLSIGAPLACHPPPTRIKNRASSTYFTGASRELNTVLTQKYPRISPDTSGKMYPDSSEQVPCQLSRAQMDEFYEVL